MQLSPGNIPHFPGRQMTSKLSPMKCLRPLRLFLLLLFTTSIAIAQDVPIVMPDGFAYGRDWCVDRPLAACASRGAGRGDCCRVGRDAASQHQFGGALVFEFQIQWRDLSLHDAGKHAVRRRSTTIPTVIIPLRFVFDAVSGKRKGAHFGSYNAGEPGQGIAIVRGT